MRRPVLYLAGLLLATGASLALAGPASAAPNPHHCNKGHHHFDDFYGYPDYDDWNSTDIDNNSGNSYDGVSILNNLFNGGVGGDGGTLLGL